MTDKAQGAAELLPCPFCGGAARIESNRDWHRLYADHDDECVFDAEDHALMFPAQNGYLLDIASTWNRRAALKAQPAATEAQGEDSARVEWISVEDRLPEQDRWVIVSIWSRSDDGPSLPNMHPAKFDGVHWTAYGQTLWCPSHWMPFPEVPQPQEKP